MKPDLAELVKNEATRRINLVREREKQIEKKQLINLGIKNLGITTVLAGMIILGTRYINQLPPRTLEYKINRKEQQIEQLKKDVTFEEGRANIAKERNNSYRNEIANLTNQIEKEEERRNVFGKVKKKYEVPENNTRTTPQNDQTIRQSNNSLKQQNEQITTEPAKENKKTNTPRETITNNKNEKSTKQKTTNTTTTKTSSKSTKIAKTKKQEIKTQPESKIYNLSIAGSTRDNAKIVIWDDGKIIDQKDAKYGIFDISWESSTNNRRIDSVTARLEGYKPMTKKNVLAKEKTLLQFPLEKIEGVQTKPVERNTNRVRTNTANNQETSSRNNQQTIEEKINKVDLPTERYSISGTEIISAGHYRVNKTITVSDQGTLIIEPGTHLYFARTAGIDIRGYIQAKGTSEEKIHLEPEENLWRGITVNEAHIHDIKHFRAQVAEERYGIKQKSGQAQQQFIHTMITDALTAIYIQRGYLALDDCKIEGSRQQAMILKEGTIQVNKSEFNHNGNKANGGVLYVQLGTAKFSNSTFSNNKANNGGVFFVDYVHRTSSGRKLSDEFNFENCKFNNNKANYAGGAILMFGNTGALFTGCTFEDNNAQIGGAMSIQFNEARGIGENKGTGAEAYMQRYLAGTKQPRIYTSQNVIIKNSRFNNNKASKDLGGGAISHSKYAGINVKANFSNNIPQDIAIMETGTIVK
ncbi:hypothetical protein K9M74_00895 [Candidatus Woesearchaeota archaeon]|nr:hypothetical protein [Candidatus Woesearchaeota archaeon]